MEQPRSSLQRLCTPAVVAFGLAGVPILHGVTPEAASNVVLDWNVTALETTAEAPFNPPLETRNLAIVHAAIFDSANAVSGEFRPYVVEIESDRFASIEAAVAAAGHFALVRLYPSRRAALDAALAASLSPIADERARSAGVRLGEAVAARILAARASDGAEAAVSASYVPGNDPGDWQPTPPASLPALDPGWGTVVPFVLSRGSEFRPGPPSAPGSRAYSRDFQEVKDVGSAASATRTPAQTDLARFWVATGAQIWNAAARQVAIAQHRSRLEDARAFALLNLAGADAFVAAWDAKFAYGQWRPITAIASADEGANPSSTADPRWRTSSTRGRSLGAQIGTYVVHHALEPRRGDPDDHSCDEPDARGGSR